MRPRCAIAICALLLSFTPGRTQEASDPVQALLEQERIRKLVESALASVTEARGLYLDDTAFVEAYTDIAYELGTADSGVIPLLANETLQADPGTFFFASYALSFHAAPEAIEALYAAVARADDEQTAYAEARKTHLIWALAAAGEVRAVRLADQGRHSVGDNFVHRQFSVLEAATILTAPDSLEILHDELSQEDLAPPQERQRTLYSIRALGRIGDPSSLPVLLSLLKSEDNLTRMEAAMALAPYPGKESIDALIAALQDPSGSVSSYAAFSLLVLLPDGRFDELAGQIETMTSPTARKAIYKLLVRLDAEAAIPILMRRTASPDPVERRAVYGAAGLTRSTAVLDLLVHGMADPDNSVGVHVLRALARIEDPRARRVLIRAIDSPRWPLAQMAAKLAADARIAGAAEAIRGRLLNVEFPLLVRNSGNKSHAEWLLELSVELLDVKALRGLEKALEVQKDGLLLPKIEAVVRQLTAARDAGDDMQKWEALAFDADPQIRETAYRHLGSVSPPDAAAEILASAFGRVEPAEAPVVIDQLAGLNTEKSRDVVERVLTTPEYQRPELYLLRDSAAWAARRLGGERMRSALQHSIEIRHGRDIRPIIYYALLSGEQATPLIDKWIVPRMRFSAITRGKEYQYLRELLTALRFGHALDASDLSPAELSFM